MGLGSCRGAFGCVGVPGLVFGLLLVKVEVLMLSNTRRLICRFKIGSNLIQNASVQNDMKVKKCFFF